MEEGTLPKDEKQFQKYLCSKYEWDEEESKKIWPKGMDENKLNILVNCTKGVEYINEVKDMIINAFHECIKKGVLCEEQLRGVRFNVNDMTVHSDPSHRGGGQIIGMAKRAFKSSQLLASPRIYEPVFLVGIQVDEKNIGNVYNVINKRNGVVLSTEKTILNMSIKSYLPVRKSFGLTTDLRSKTSGKAFTQCNFDHWDIIDIDPLEEDSKIKDEILNIRKRKNLNELEIPPLDRFLDKL